MRISIFLIIGFTHFVFCCDLNDTHDFLPVCPNQLFRRKRQIPEYTRWRANLDTTPEFIVKVLDEDLSTARPKKIVAVNIQPVTKGREKIIIGGAIVSTTKTVTTPSELLNDYTRFVPPTTSAREGTIIAPIKPNLEQFLAMLPRAKNPQRDESPPAGPQFVSRNSLSARQFAPITPVGFTRRFTVGPLTPPSTSTQEPYNFRKMMDTSPFEELLSPTRVKPNSEEYDNFPHEDNSYHLSTVSKEYNPTTSQHEIDDYLPRPLEKGNDSDSFYGNLFYDDDESDGEVKKTTPNLYDADSDKIKDSRKQVINTNRRNEPEKNDMESRQNSDVVQRNRESSINVSVKIQSAPKTTADPFRIAKKDNICSMTKLRPLSFDLPRTLPEIVAKMKKWAEESPVAKWADITDGNFTSMENPIYMMIVDDPSSGQIITAKQTVMIVGGIQGRDQHAVTAAMYVLYELIERSSYHTDILTKFRFWVIPVLNPDGYDYAMTFPHRRNWAKNLRQNWDFSCKGRNFCQNCEEYGLGCTIKSCYGVNLDRNFEYQWIPTEELHAEHPCGPLYAGERQLSEAETHAFTKLMHDKGPLPATFIAFKEGDVLGVMYPYSHTKKVRAHDEVLRRQASRAARAASSITGRNYLAGQTSEFLPLYAGGIEDWVDGHLGIDNTYTIMMVQQADHNIPTEKVVREAYAAMDTLVLQSGEHLDKPRALMENTRRSNANTMTTSLILLTFVIVLTIFI